MPKRKFDETVNVPMQLSEKCTSLRKSILSEDGALKYDFMISLQKIAMAKIITSLFMNGDTAQQYVKQRNMHSSPMDFIKNKISALRLPSTFTKALINVFQSVGESVVYWIRYHDLYVFSGSISCIIRKDNYARSYINNIKWNSRGRIDYKETARNILAIRKNCLSDENKYRLACTYCLEDEIVVIAPKVVHEGYLDRVNVYKYPMIYFFTAHITGDPRKFPITSFFPTDRFFLNEVSIRYMWNRLRAEEKSAYISSLMENDSASSFRCQDFIYFLLSTMNYQQQQDAFRKHSNRILKSMKDDWLWEEYFLPTALHVLNIMQPHDYAEILRTTLFEIADQIKETGSCKQSKSTFKVLWREAPMSLKILASRKVKGALSWNCEWVPVDLYETVLKDFNAEQKKSFIFGDIEPLGQILRVGKFDMADHLIKYCEASPDEINHFKSKLMLSNNMEYFESFFHSTQKYILPLVIKWCNPSKETVEKLKEKVKNDSSFQTRYTEDYKPEYFYELLDEFLANRNYLNSAANKKEPQCRITKD